MWWLADDEVRFQDSPCFQSWDDVYRMLDGIESWVLGTLIVAMHPDAVSGVRAKYPSTPQHLVERRGAELDPAWEPKASEWWRAMKLSLTILEKEQKEPVRLVGFVRVGANIV